ncbi:NADP-dependent oxidoreductase [Nocardia sp. CDC159]|uniref:NADP-dependent oxidoreductase n=1 Tax=Nocardia pulmonis TaxID=2951408 RepID=A0A9X2IV21_9NOCA|nr:MULTISPECIES: NADP-dependent oxidoreductase [Nocardia]MCM6773437.1 NADP-dependent oxidoreductase [Nocardia pulmonis]MCM6786324.1 NADP-dependent oxidoreductase [Nocardia sp. CDC159]
MTTKAITIETFGGPEVLRLRQVPLSAPKPGEVLLLVEATGVNPADLGMRDGRYPWARPPRLPLVPGYDIAGAVEAVGSGVTALAPGDRVTATTAHAHTQIGSYRERVVLPADQVVLAADLDVETRATLPLAGTVALQALRRLGLRAGQRLLVHGAAGAVGAFAARLAVHRGITVHGTASRADHDYLRSIGVRPLDRDLVPARDGYDAAFDTVDGPSARSAFAAVRDDGRYVTIVPEFWIPGGQFEPERGIAPELVVYSHDHADLSEVVRLATAGVLRARIADVLPIADAAEAHRRLLAGRVRGKLVLRP